MKLDYVDEQILQLLKENARESFRSIAEKISKTEATVRRRVKTLQDEEFI